MKRATFLKSIATLFAAPSVLKNIKPKPDYLPSVGSVTSQYPDLTLESITAEVEKIKSGRLYQHHVNTGDLVVFRTGTPAECTHFENGIPQFKTLMSREPIKGEYVKFRTWCPQYEL